MSEIQGPESSKEGMLEGLFARYEAPLLRYATRLVRDFDAAQEIVQESFMRLHAHFDQVLQPRPWLYRTTHNLALNHLRGERHIVSWEAGVAEIDRAPHEPIDDRPLPAETVGRQETITQTRQCLERLVARDRELIALKFEEGLSYKEISQRTGLSVSNVGFLLHHALKKLAVALVNAGVEL